MVEEEVFSNDTELLEQLYLLVGEPPEGELVSDVFLRERREEAVREANEDE